MNLTNHHNLPEPVVRAILRDDYDKGDADYSCSELVDPPRITLLKQRHADQIVEDASERLWSLFGQLGHKLLEQAGADNALLEERLFATVAGRRISGKSDIGQWVYEDGEITDYKFTSVYTAMNKRDRLPDWERAQNIYAYLYQVYGFLVRSLRICAFYRDWKLAESKKRDDYPPPVEIIPLRLWDVKEQMLFIEKRVKALKAAEKLPDDQLPECTPEQMWERPTTWAVMKKGRKSALRVLESRSDAFDWCKKNGYTAEPELHPALKKGISIEKRPGRRVRCEDYCPAASFCNQFQAYASAK